MTTPDAEATRLKAEAARLAAETRLRSMLRRLIEDAAEKNNLEDPLYELYGDCPSILAEFVTALNKLLSSKDIMYSIAPQAALTIIGAGVQDLLRRIYPDFLLRCRSIGNESKNCPDPIQLIFEFKSLPMGISPPGFTHTNISFPSFNLGLRRPVRQSASLELGVSLPVHWSVIIACSETELILPSRAFLDICHTPASRILLLPQLFICRFRIPYTTKSPVPAASPLHTEIESKLSS